MDRQRGCRARARRVRLKPTVNTRAAAPKSACGTSAATPPTPPPSAPPRATAGTANHRRAGTTTTASEAEAQAAEHPEHLQRRRVLRYTHVHPELLQRPRQHRPMRRRRIQPLRRPVRGV